MATECIETQEWIEEEISRPVEQWVEKTEEKCRERPWYDPLGWFCWLVTFLVKVIVWVVVKVGKWVVRTVCKVVTAIVDIFAGVLTGLWDVIAGIFTLDGRRILDGLLGIVTSIVDGLLRLIRVLWLIDTILYIYEEYARGQLRDYVRGLLEARYRGQDLADIKDSLRLDHGAFGLRLSMRAVRTFIDSETPSPDQRGVPNLVVLHERGDIDLHELCGFEFNEGFWNRKRYKTLKKETVVAGGGGGEFDNPISREELDEYLSSRGARGPAFTVLCMRDGVLDTKLRAAELKGRELGLVTSWNRELREVVLPHHINHNGFDTNRATSSMVAFLKEVIGRTGAQTDEAGALREVCTPAVVGVFRYTDKLRGLAACLKGSSCQDTHDASGATFIDSQPDIVWKYVPIHELGHYFGLCHMDGLDRIMYSPREKSWFTWATIPKLVLINGEPTFSLDEAKQAWDYIVAHFPAHCLGAREAQRPG